MKSYFLVIVVLLGLCSTVSANQNLVLSVHPFLKSTEIEQRFAPLANYLGEKLGVKISVKVGSSYDDHIQAIGEDKVDFAYMGPASYVSLVKEYGNKPLLARMEVNHKPTFQGDIITRKDSPYKTLADLKGQTFAFTDHKSTMGYVVPHYMLVEAGVLGDDDKAHIFLGTHQNVALGVLAGDYAAGAVKPAVFKEFEARGLRVITSTPEISEHLFVASKRLPETVVEALRKAMLEAGQSEQGIAALKKIKHSVTGLVSVQDSDYDNLRVIYDSLEKAH